MQYNTISNILNRVLLTLVVFVVIIGSLINVQTSAELFVTPKNSYQEKALFYSIKPGETKFDSFDINNANEENSSITLQANDIVVTGDGSVTLLQNSEENKGLGSWLDMLKGAIIIKPNSKINIPLKIQVPADAKSGEYGAAVSVTTKSNNQSESTVKSAVRKGLKIYVYVEGDTPIVSSKINSISLLNPQSENKDQIEKKLSYWDKNNIVFSYKAQDLGNTFSVIKGKYTISLPDGQEKTGDFNTNLVPNVSEKEYFVSTSIPYQSGKTNIKIDYQVEALNKDRLGDSKSENINGTLFDNIELNNKTLAQFRGINYPENKKEQNGNNTIILAYILGTSIGVLVLFVLYKLIRKRYIKL